MDILWFLRRRLQFVSTLYNGATDSFQETIRKIKAGEPPYVDRRNPEHDDVSEPAFLEEYQEASESIEAIGHWCLCMAYASLKAFLETFIEEMARDFSSALGDLPAKLAAKKGKSWFERHRLLFLEDLRIDWAKAPVKVDDLEQINLARDDVVHNVDVTTAYIYQTEKHAERYPKGLFVDELWVTLGLGGRVRIGRDELTNALALVDAFCTWLEEIRVRYPDHLKSAD